MVALDERLGMLARMVPACDMAADIGADHGFLGVYLIESGRCKRMQLMDISEDSLAKARRLVRGEGLEDRVLFSVGDGAQALVEPVQAAVVAGMGGVTIAGIIARGRECLGSAQLILQPNVAARELREQLVLSGYRIEEEQLSRAAGRWYLGIRAVPGEAAYSEDELLIGPKLLSEGHPFLKDYAAFRARVLEKAIRGAGKSEGERAERMTCQLEGELEKWRPLCR